MSAHSTPLRTQRFLTGITTTGTPHLGNFVGSIRPSVAASLRPEVQSFYFLADYHALVKCEDPARIQRSTLEIAASWLAAGLDPERVTFYRQSDIPEIPELMWLLTCVVGKGVLNRAHAYKAAVDKNQAAGNDIDADVNAGLFMYPVLMAADILLFRAHHVPVGRDQIQHIEMARDMANSFNHLYGKHLVAPQAVIEESVALLPGLDGRKMSKSYDNTIPLFAPPEALRKLIANIVTDSRLPGEPKDTDQSALFQIYQAFASGAETTALRQAFADGIGWGDAKQHVFARIDQEIAPMRETYHALIADPARIERTLMRGAEKARALASPLMRELRQAVGLRSLGGALPGRSETDAPAQAGTSGAFIAADSAANSVAATATLTAAATATQTAPAIAANTTGLVTAKKAGKAIATPSLPLPVFKQYRESDGRFYFKLVDAQDKLLLQSAGFDSPQGAAAAIALLRQTGDMQVLLDAGKLKIDAITTNAEIKSALQLLIPAKV